jgi:hypothetical protein
VSCHGGYLIIFSCVLTSRNHGEYTENLNYFKLLLLSIYSIAARQMDWQNTLTDGQSSSIDGQLYFEQAKMILSMFIYLFLLFASFSPTKSACHGEFPRRLRSQGCSKEAGVDFFTVAHKSFRFMLPPQSPCYM